MSKVVALGLADKPKTLSYTNIQTLTTSKSRLVPFLLLSRLYPRGTRQFDHIDVAVGSFSTSLKTLSHRHKTMALLTLSTISVFYARDMVTDNKLSPFKAFSHFCYINTASIFTFHNPKSLSPVNFSISHFEPMVLDYPLTLAPWWAPTVVNSLKNHTNNNLMCGAS